MKTIPKLLLALILLSIQTVKAQGLKSSIFAEFNSGNIIGETKNGLLYEGDGVVWRTDGTTSGTKKLAIRHYHRYSGVVFKGEIYFLTTYDTLKTQSCGIILWKTDGTDAGTVKIKTFPEYESFREVVTTDKLMFFKTLGNVDNDLEDLWRTDGTSSGTFKLLQGDLKQLYPVQWLKRLGDKLLFSAQTADFGRELWVSDGTVGGTKMVVDLNTGLDYGIETSFPQNGIEYNGYIYYLGKGPTTDEYGLFRTNGTASGTELISNKCSGIDQMFVMNNVMYFIAYYRTGTPVGQELWRSDGTDNGTYLVKDTRPGTSTGMYHLNVFRQIGNKFIFCANDGTTGNELWISDGTEAGTKLLMDINTNTGYPNSGNPIFIYSVYVGNKIIFSAFDVTHGTEMWSTDGTPEGTKLEDDIIPGKTNSDPIHFTIFKGDLYFISENNGTKLEALRKVSNVPPATNSINNLKDKLDAEIFPVPSKEFLNFKFPQAKTKLHCNIKGVTGNQIMSIEFEQNEIETGKIDIQSLQSGVYLLEITDSQGNYIQKKFIKN